MGGFFVFVGYWGSDGRVGVVVGWGVDGSVWMYFLRAGMRWVEIGWWGDRGWDSRGGR